MNQDARKIGFNILLGIAFYLPIEDFILRWLPFPRGLLIVLRQAPEALVWIVALGAAALHLSKHGTIIVIGRRIDRFLIGFVVVATATIIVNGADFLGAAVSLKALLRYIPLIYALIMLAPDNSQLARVPRLIVLAFGIQVAVGMAEWLGGQPVRSFFSVIHAWGGYSIVGVPVDVLQFYERLDLTGTIARPMGYAYFILAGLAVWIVHHEKRRGLYLLGVVLSLLVTFYTHSRMAVFAVVLVVVMHQLAIRGVTKTMGLALLLLPLFAAVTLSLGSAFAENLYILDVFTGEYREHALKQRLGLIVYMLPYAFNGGISLFGYSPDLDIVAAAVAERFDLPTTLAYMFTTIVEDVYWLAMLLYYGFVGFTFFVVFYGKLTMLAVRLYKRAADETARQYALTAVLLLLLTIPLNGINQAFEFRQYAYYLWLYTGVAIVAARNAMNNPPQPE